MGKKKPLNPGKEIFNILEAEGITAKELWHKMGEMVNYNWFRRKIAYNKLSAMEFVEIVDKLGYEVRVYKKW